jgi:hypothetical protein
MKSFPRPDIAEGIFYEYLRYDDPISPELRDRVVDGFPFLLAPLAQVRGVSIGGQGGNNVQPKSASKGNPVFNLLGGFADIVKTQSVEMAVLAKKSAADAAEHAGAVAKLLGETLLDVGREMDRRRDTFVKHSVAVPGIMTKMVSRDPDAFEAFSRWMAGRPSIEEEAAEEAKAAALLAAQRIPKGRAFGYPLSRWFGEDYYASDEIGPLKIHPTINRIILTLVHLYLLLLFLVSFPSSYSTRTKLVIRSKLCASRDISDSESETSSDENVRTDCDRENHVVPRRRPSFEKRRLANQRVRKGADETRHLSRANRRTVLWPNKSDEVPDLDEEFLE